jgi:hypothetical protein
VIISALTRPLIIGSALVVAIFATNVGARQPTVFMLQFGSFETRNEAEAKIKSIGTKHGGMLVKYPAVIREIIMPPDNLAVYRTQAGPAQTREDAQAVCAQLASQGDECYVVETAMVTPGAAPIVQQAGIVPAVEDDKIIPTDSKPLPSRDPDNVKAIEKVAAPMPKEQKQAMNAEMDSAAAAPTMTTPTPRIGSGARVPTAAQVEEKEEEGSFWSWLSGDDEESEDDQWTRRKLEAEKRAQEAAAATRAAPVDDVVSQEADMLAPPAPAPVQAAQAAVPEAAPVDIVAPNLTTSTPEADPAFAPPAPVLAPQSQQPFQQAAAIEPLPAADAQLGNQGLRLPPPPPPTEAAKAAMARGDGMSSTSPISAQPAAPWQAGPAPVLASPAPEQTGSITTSPLPPAPFKTGASVGKDGGEVQVGEAQRVPLTEAKQQAPVEQPVARVIGVNEVPEVADARTPPPPSAQPVAPPSSAAVQKTLWAHIHYFPDQQAALGFWDAYRKAHPDFPVVRVRTTSSLIAQQQGDMRVALRIGPFAQQGFINILCNSIRAVHQNIQCGAITDMGASSNAYAPRDRYAQAVAQAARYTNQLVQKNEGFWVQLGTYTSADEAKIAWEDAQTQHGDTLADMKPEIITPQQGSPAQHLFRLRTGPFNTQMAAKDVCSRVKVNSGACLVVSD